MTNSLIVDKLNSYAENSKFKENIKKVFLWKDKVPVIEFQFLNRKFGVDVVKTENALQIGTHWRKGSLQYEYFIKEVRASSFENLFSDLDTIVDRFASFILKKGSIEISVIVPVYNREELIKPLINSLNNQSLDKEKFEVIFIDDGSTDSSVSVIEKFAEINYRIIRRSNGSGSASTPRNEGINNAFGDYLLFIDSDDFFDVDCLRSVINLAKESDADIVYLKTEGLNGRQCSARTFSGKENILKAGIFKNALLMHGFPCKAFRTSLIRDNNIFYNPSFKLEEDKLFLFEALALSKNVAILKDKAYVYLTRHEGEHLGRSKEKTKYRVYKLWYMYLMYCLRIPDEIRRKEFYNQLMFRFAVKYSAEIDRKIHSEDLDLIVKEFKCHLNLFDSKYIYKDGIEQVEKVFSITGVENVKQLEIEELPLGNKIFKLDSQGVKLPISVSDIKNLEIIYKGKTSEIILSEGLYIKDKLRIYVGEGCKIFLDKNVSFHKANLDFSGTNSIFTVGENSKLRNVQIFCSAEPNLKVEIGRDCIFSLEVVIRPCDGHTILSAIDKTVLNKPSFGVSIGDHVWIGQRVLITKDAVIPSDCIIGAGSVVGKKKFVPNSVIAGVPAGIVKSDITWSDKTICKYEELVK